MAQRESNENKRKAMLKIVTVLKKKMKNLQDKIRILKKSTALEYLV